MNLELCIEKKNNTYDKFMGRGELHIVPIILVNYWYPLPKRVVEPVWETRFD